MTPTKSVYISASTNNHSQAASISSSSLIAFATQKLVALWNPLDPSEAGVTSTLPGHNADVNCVKIASNGDVIFSGDQSGMLQVRTKISGTWKIVLNHKAHPNAISTLAVHEQFVITGSSDSTIKIWKLSLQTKNSIDLAQVLDMNGRLPLDVKVTSFPETHCLILAISSTGRNVEIWARGDGQFVHSVTLSGHDDWVKSLDFTISRHSPPQMTLASGSHDGTIRLWTMDAFSPVPQNTAGGDAFDFLDASLGYFNEGEEGIRELTTKRHVMTVKFSNGETQHFSLCFDALLVGHEAGVTTVSWRPGTASPPTLLSTSVDSSLIMWSPSSVHDAESPTALWISTQRFGDVGGQRPGGFVGGLWTADGREALAWGWNGGWRRWSCEKTGSGSPEVWTETGAITGHHGPVKSIGWDLNGDYLLSTGLDQTARIHGPHHRHTRGSSNQEAWHELARPQVHGYDIVGAEFLSPLRFISIADEKVARVFDAPKTFLAMLNTLSIPGAPLNMDSRPHGANVPPLGLSNKAVDDGEYDHRIHELSTRRYPFEGELASLTLWPEVEKVFGHGYELISIAVSHSGSFAVTASKSSSAEHSRLRVYNTRDWQLFGHLDGHSLTVTRIAFNPDDDMILSVSRDRTWRLFRKNPDQDGYSPLAVDKSHTRIIWDCAWARELSQIAFATASRDKTVKIWEPADASLTLWTASATLKFKEAVTAVDFSPVLSDGRRRLALGLESGEIFIYSSKSDVMHEWTLEIALDPISSHAGCVNRVLWRPTKDFGEKQQLATCSEDRTVRLLTVHLNLI